MRHAIRKICYAQVLLFVLLTAIVGQKVHIYTENPLHFAAFSGDLVPDNGATCGMIEKCVVDDFPFFPCVCTAVTVLTVYFVFISGRADASTCPKQAAALRLCGLRAPPAAC